MNSQIIKLVATTVGGSLVGLIGGKLLPAKHIVSKPDVMQVAKESLKEVPKEIWIGLGLGVSAIGAFAFLRRRQLKRRCLEYAMQFKEKIGITTTSTKAVKPSSLVMESVRVSSEEHSQVKPKCQLLVGNINGGTFNIYGSAVRVWDSIVMPNHVLCDAAVDGMVYVKGNQNITALEVDNFDLLDTDLAAIKCKDTELSRIGAPLASFDEYLSDKGEWVAITGVLGKGTNGRLNHDPTCFGKVIYSGTTMPGYSGGLYMAGNLIMGMHCWGGAVNGGYSISYVKILVHRFEKKKPESTEDFLKNLFENKRLKRADVKPRHGYGEVEFRYNGQYHMVDEDTWFKVTGTKMDLPVGYQDYEMTQIKESFINIDTNPGESRDLMTSGASGTMEKPDLCQLSVSSLSMKETETLLNRLGARKNELNLLGKMLKDQSTSTVGLLSTEKQN
nr:MAG: VP1 protein [Solemoviridae sp. 3]